jgi:hypothetical protein
VHTNSKGNTQCFRTHELLNIYIIFIQPAVQQIILKSYRMRQVLACLSFLTFFSLRFSLVDGCSLWACIFVCLVRISSVDCVFLFVFDIILHFFPRQFPFMKSSRIV